MTQKKYGNFFLFFGMLGLTISVLAALKEMGLDLGLILQNISPQTWIILLFVASIYSIAVGLKLEKEM